MSKARIQNPRVFISYAWGSEESQSRVLAFAEALVRDGIDVVLDKWSLAEGNDTFAFMEKCVTDTSITNVLMLLDPIYAQKADAHEGGVGTETQIISPQVYQKVEQTKFIPVVFERDPDGKVYKPTYLQGRLHFDLSMTDKYDIEYQRLVKRLYGIEIYEKPELGVPPKWLEEPVNKSRLLPNRYDILRTNAVSKARIGQWLEFLNDIKGRIVEYTIASDITGSIERYEQMRPLRDDYLHLLKNYAYVDNSGEGIAAFFEDTRNAITNIDNAYNLKKLFIHELFVYTVSYLLKQRDYVSAGELLGKTYFSNLGQGSTENFNMFFCDEYEYFSAAVCERDNLVYHSGVAKYWTENIDTELLNQADFIFGDMMCYNVSVFGNVISNGWYWFPLSYVYDNRYNSAIKGFAQKLVSKERAVKVLPLFGYETIDQLKEKFSDITKRKQANEFRAYRFPAAYEEAPLLCRYIESEDIGTLK